MVLIVSSVSARAVALWDALPATNVLLQYECILGALGVDGKMMFEWILGKFGGKVWTRCIRLRVATSGENLRYRNEPSGSIESGEFLD
jgi:hypothetical protein